MVLNFLSKYHLPLPLANKVQHTLMNPTFDYAIIVTVDVIVAMSSLESSRIAIS